MSGGGDAPLEKRLMTLNDPVRSIALYTMDELVDERAAADGR